ncbi:glycosyltransferase [Synechococcus sp. UW179A]|uniref:glycosyltransferase n=1 Tax=Synechococcus sp. UW179A TaxID=2575510 RepID=UPI000E0F81C5|nr:glycosyltransferase [Synechococcus sp. UW179A]
MTAPPLILVVGMHRSGTSLLGSILKSLGVTLPGPLIPGDHLNPAGYFERTDITALQEELLIDMQRWWPSEQGTLALPQDWLTTARAKRSAACLKRLLILDLQQQSDPWAIKDPRTSLLLPLWRQVAAELNLPLRLLLAFRDPAEVVTSLVNRDATSTGMTAARAQALWIRHQQQPLIDADELPLQVVSYSRWFEAPEPQIEALQRFCHLKATDTTAVKRAQACIRPDLRRSLSNQQSPALSRKVQHWHQQLERAATGSIRPLQRWASRQSLPASRSSKRRRSNQQRHSWSLALNALGNQTAADQKAGIQAWEEQGISALSLGQLRRLNQPGFPGHDPSCGDGGPLPSELRLALIGGSMNAWTSHLWINVLPLSSECRLLICSPEAPADAALHLQTLEVTAQNPALLLQLSKVSRVFDPDPEQVRLLRLLGVNAETLPTMLNGQSETQGTWLKPGNSSHEAASQLGLPNPQALVANGGQWLCLGGGERQGWDKLPANLFHCPVFPPAPALSEQQAYTLAGWISACLSAGFKLIRLDPDTTEQPLWNSLAIASFEQPIHPDELLEELAWREAGQPEPAEIQTPKPAVDLIWEQSNGISPEVAICISSYNYAKRLPSALQSCFSQSLQDLELVIVDDHSTDNSLSRCLEWLENHGQRFRRVKLLKHRENAGLAAARNTAFSAATAPWCWVLDADNQIDPKTCEVCLQLAKASPDTTAVVHPLIRILDDNSMLLGLTGGGHPWQREQLRAGNVIDAMALVRRCAWEAVGGYSHILGGWEDFDFWCKLIEAGWHGVLYPQPLATYTQHGTSMLQSQTNQRQRQLSRLLQHRHPWLQLAFAAENS